MFKSLALFLIGENLLNIITRKWVCMNGQKEIYRSVELDDSVKTSSLGVLDQIKLIIKSFTNNDEAELETESRLSRAKLKKLAALRDFIDRAIAEMQKRGEHMVTLKVSNEFLPYVDEVIDSKYGYGRFYDITVGKGQRSSVVSKYFILRIKTKNEDAALEEG